ncbi:MAG: ROK family protein [Bacteroidota bacterium]
MRWGVNLGSAEIDCIVLDHTDTVLARKSVGTDSDLSYGHILDQMSSLIDSLTEQLGQRPKCLGVSIPGYVDFQTGILHDSTVQSLNYRPFDADLTRRLGVPVFVSNTANCFTLAEYYKGVVFRDFRSAKSVFGIVMDSNVGGAFIYDGKIHQGQNYLSNSWAHTVLDPNGPECFCGKKGCVETYLSVEALESYYLFKSGRSKRLHDIYLSYENGVDIIAEETIERLIKYFGLAISNLINTLGPDVIILGGKVANLSVLYDRGLQEVNKNVFRHEYDTPIHQAYLGNQAELWGATYLMDTSNISLA